MTNDPEKIRLVTRPGAGDGCIPLKEIVDMVMEAHARCSKNRPGAIRKAAERMAQVFDRYSPAVNVVVQTQPDPVAFLWGAIRLSVLVGSSSPPHYTMKAPPPPPVINFRASH